MKIYIAGKVTGLKPTEYGLKFGYTASKLRKRGHSIINPVPMLSDVFWGEFSHADLMHICYSAIDVCDAVYMLKNWTDSRGAKLEHEYALKNGKKIYYEEIKGVEI